jgi:hypothetical protein
MDYNLTFTVNNKKHSFDIQAKSFKYGKPVCRFEDYLFTNEEFLREGYVISEFPILWKHNIKNAITDFVVNVIKKYSNVNLKDFSLEKYHLYVDENVHKEVVKKIRGGDFGLGGISLDYLGVPYKNMDWLVNDKIGSSKLSAHYKRYGFSMKKFWIRLIRPNSLDNNPPHKDGFLSRVSRNVNIYLPIAGSNENSSLPLIPKSHLDKDSEYIISSTPYYVNGKKFTVPAAVHRKNGLDMITPNPSDSEIMIFTPWLIHGGGINSNTDSTRVSLEMRFFA